MSNNITIEMESIDLEVRTDVILMVEIDVFRFTKECGLSSVLVEIENHGEHEYLEEVNILNKIQSINQLKEFALSWLSIRVEIVKKEA